MNKIDEMILLWIRNTCNVFFYSDLLICQHKYFENSKNSFNYDDIL